MHVGVCVCDYVSAKKKRWKRMTKRRKGLAQKLVLSASHSALK